jgi:hypothetical protein
MARLSAVLLSATLLAAGGHAAAQQPPGEQPSVAREEAERQYKLAREARMANDPAACHARAAGALALHRTAKIAALLGDCAVDIGRHREAAEALSYALDNPPEVKPELLEHWRARLAEAKRHVAALALSASVDGATCTVDGTPVDGLPKTIFLDPGQHVFEGVRAGYVAKKQALVVAAGTDTTLELVLVPVDGSAAPDPSPHGYDSEAAGRSYAPEIAAGVIAAAGIGAGIALLALSSSTHGDADDALASLRAESGRQQPCNPPFDDTRCADLASDRDDGDLFLGVGIASMSLGGAALITGLVHLLVADDGSSASRVRLTPQVSDRGAAVTLTVRF